MFVILSTSIWGQTVINGDLNHDNNLNVSDVTSIISTILGEKDKEIISMNKIDYYKVDISLIKGEWWISRNEKLSFEDNGNGYYNSFTRFYYKFHPCQGKILIYNEQGMVTNYYTVLDISPELLVITDAKGEINHLTHKQPEAEQLYIIGNFCDWNFDNAIKMVPLFDNEDVQWHIVYIDNSEIFIKNGNVNIIDNIKIDPSSECKDVIKINNGGISSIKEGWYLLILKKLHVSSSKSEYMATINTPDVRLIGPAMGDNSYENSAPFSIPESPYDLFVSPATKATSGNDGDCIRMFVNIPGVNWWKSEFIIGIDGNKISYRGSGGDQDRVGCEDNQHIYLNFNNDTGELK